MMKGKVLLYKNGKIFFSRGYSIFSMTEDGLDIKKITSVPVSLLSRIVCLIPLFSRLLRRGIYNAVAIQNGLVIQADKALYVYNYCSDTCKFIGNVEGSRPMFLCSHPNGKVYFGDYRSNEERGPISIRCIDPQSCSVRPIYQFDDIRHIHGVFYDEYTDRLWVTTGDDDSECGIFYSDDEFVTIHCMVRGSQQYRAVQLLFTEKHIYYGSDAPDQTNFIYKISRETRVLKKLAKVDGPVFFGFKLENVIGFSTSVEPSAVNTHRYSQLWISKDGETFFLQQEFIKDFLSMKFFQYGQVFLVAGSPTLKRLWYTPYSTHKHMHMLYINFQEKD